MFNKVSIFIKENSPRIPTTTRVPSTTIQATLAEIIVTQQPQLKSTYDDYTDPIISSTVPSSEVTSEMPELAAASSTTEDTSEVLDYDENENERPTVIKRIKKIQATSGKAFSHKLEGPIFSDDQDTNELQIELLDKIGNKLPQNSWIRYNAGKEEIYGLPLEKDVSRHEFKLRATDKAGLHVEEDVDITVQQHKSFRSVNHEIYIQITVEKKFEAMVDWEIRLIRGIAESLEDESLSSIIVRDGE
jgi:dystroglycan 1